MSFYYFYSALYSVTDVSPDSPDHYLVGHCIDGRILYPATGYLVLAWRSLAGSLGMAMEQTAVMFEEVTIHQATILPQKGEWVVLSQLQQLKERKERNAKGKWEELGGGGQVIVGVQHVCMILLIVQSSNIYSHLYSMLCGMSLEMMLENGGSNWPCSPVFLNVSCRISAVGSSNHACFPLFWSVREWEFGCEW